MSVTERAVDILFDSGSLAQIIVDRNGRLAQANECARALFCLAAQDIGRPLQDLELSYRPVELRSLIDEANSRRRAVLRHNIPWIQESGTVTLNVEVLPLADYSGTLLGIGVTFRDVTQFRRLQEELEQSNRQLESAYEELQSTNEELETTNEELQSSGEELQTTNEELQSTNEELETMNEELRLRTQEVNRINTFMESILNSLNGGVIVLDRDLHVLVWNDKSEDLWGLRAEEVVGRNYLGLDIGLPVEELRPLLVSAINAGTPCQETHLDATNRRGKPIRCRIHCTPLMKRGEINGAVLFTEETGGSPQ